MKADKIDIPDYQYWLGYNAKRLDRLILLEKSSYINRKNRHIPLLCFQK